MLRGSTITKQMKNDYFPTQFYGVGPKKREKVPLLPQQLERRF
jgi:hypothetical protein